MNLGVFYENSNITDLFSLLYVLQKFDVEFLNSNGSSLALEKFKIKTDKVTFHFSHDIEDLTYCNKIILVRHPNGFQFVEKYYHRVDFVIIATTAGEYEQQYLEQTIKFLERPNVFYIAAHPVPDEIKTHPRVVVDHAVNLFFFYYYFGFHFLNFYKQPKKENLVGVYNLYGPAYKPDRHNLLAFMQEWLDHPIISYKSGDFLDNQSRLFDKLAWIKGSQHIPSYTDFNQSVVNIVFETYGTLSPSPLIFTEKTLKALLFARAEIIFVYAGNYEQLDWLHERGFWFLNSEFYNKGYSLDSNQEFLNLKTKHYIEENNVNISIIKTFEYLVNLKKHLKDNDAVYEYLLTKYRSKIENNAVLIQNLLGNCGYTNRLENFLGIKFI